MKPVTSLRAEFVETMPDTLVDGVIYISEKYRVALHSCCCGCGEEVSTPIGPTEFSISTTAGEGISVYPSIGNHDFPCRSHYWIKRGKVVWSYEMSRKTIDQGRAHDRYLKRGESKLGIGAAMRWMRAFMAKLFD